ncbi:MAG: vWA domain-containing protein [Parvularculaceae bacterium]
MMMNAAAKFTRAARSFAAARGGNVAMLVGLLLVPLLLGAGVAIDFGRSAQAKAVIQEACDAAILRAAQYRSQNDDATDAELTELARRVFNAATASLSSVIVNSFGVAYDSATETFSLSLDAQMRTSLMGAVGVRTLPLNAAAAVTLGKPPYLEVALALDNTGSMKDNDKIDHLKESATALAEALFAKPNGGVKIGLVPFAQYANVGDWNAGEPWMAATGAGWKGCVGSRDYPAEMQDGDYDAKPVPGVSGNLCPEPIIPMTEDKDAVLAAIDDMKASGLTYIPAGLVWGWRLLTPQAPFSQGLSFDDIDKVGGTKALVVLTDGENTRAPTYPEHDSTNTALANDLMIQLCDAIKAEGIVIYAVAFDISDPTIRTLLEQCGTTPDHYFAPTDADELAEAFMNIATSLRSLSLSR